MVKRLIDIIFSIIMVLMLLPLFSVIFILIKLEDAGPVFYRGLRVGMDGRIFKIFKLRTMIINAEENGCFSTKSDDLRITKMGKFIRKYNLDELPQFINVIKGEMSIVGPRPEVKKYVDMFTEEEKFILTVRPGITDWSTIWISDEGKILAGSNDPDKDYVERIRPQKLRLQLKYARNHSLTTDFKIMLETLKVHLINRIRNKN